MLFRCNYPQPLARREKTVNIFSRPSAKVLALSGTQVVKYERSITHACARAAVREINEAHAIDDGGGELWAEFIGTAPGKSMLDAIDAYTIFALGKRVRQ